MPGLTASIFECARFRFLLATALPDPRKSLHRVYLVAVLVALGSVLGGVRRVSLAITADSEVIGIIALGANWRRLAKMGEGGRVGL